MLQWFCVECTRFAADSLLRAFFFKNKLTKILERIKCSTLWIGSRSASKANTSCRKKAQQLVNRMIWFAIWRGFKWGQAKKFNENGHLFGINFLSIFRGLAIIPMAALIKCTWDSLEMKTLYLCWIEKKYDLNKGKVKSESIRTGCTLEIIQCEYCIFW